MLKKTKTLLFQFKKASVFIKNIQVLTTSTSEVQIIKQYTKKFIVLETMAK